MKPILHFGIVTLRNGSTVGFASFDRDSLMVQIAGWCQEQNSDSQPEPIDSSTEPLDPQEWADEIVEQYFEDSRDNLDIETVAMEREALETALANSATI